MITQEIKLSNYEWITDEAALLNACVLDKSIMAMLSACTRLNIIGFTSVENGHDQDDCVGYVEFTFDPEVEMLLTLGQPV